MVVEMQLAIKSGNSKFIEKSYNILQFQSLSLRAKESSFWPNNGNVQCVDQQRFQIIVLCQ